MKKIFTILLAAGTVSFASAQSTSHNGNYGRDERGNSRDVILGQSNSSVYRNNNSGYGSYTFTARERDEQIQRVNHEFDQKIAAVKRDRHLRSYEKSRQIKLLEKQRQEQIGQVQMRFSDSRNRSWQDKDRYDNRKW